MTLEEARTLVEEYRALPDDLNMRLNWPGYAKLPHYTLVCRQCGKTYKRGQVGLDDLTWMVDHGKLTLTLEGICWKCEGPEEEEEGEDEEED